MTSIWLFSGAKCYLILSWSCRYLASCHGVISLSYTKYSFTAYYSFFAAIFSLKHQLTMVIIWAQYLNEILCAKCQAHSTLFWCFSELYPRDPNQGQSEGDNNFYCPLCTGEPYRDRFLLLSGFLLVVARPRCRSRFCYNKEWRVTKKNT